MPSFGERPAIFRYGSVLIAGAAAGAIAVVYANGGKGINHNDYSDALLAQADRAAIGKPFDTDLMTTDKVTPGSKQNIQFALREMLRLAGEDTKKPDAATLAAAKCTIALTNKIPLPDQAKNEWSAAQTADRSEDDKIHDGAEKLYEHAGQLCIGVVNAAADAQKLPVLEFPVNTVTE